MITVLRGENVGEQRRPSHAALNRAAGAGACTITSHPGAAQLGTHVTNHLEARRNPLQDLGDIFAQLAQRAAALGAGLLLRFMGLDLARKMRGQRTPRRLALQVRRRGAMAVQRRRCLLGAVRFQFFQLQLQLFDLPLDLLRLAPELHPLQLGDQQLQVLDLLLARETSTVSSCCARIIALNAS